jgi:hypothetical protein
MPTIKSDLKECSSDFRIFNILSQKHLPLRFDDLPAPGHGFTCRRGGDVPFFSTSRPSSQIPDSVSGLRQSGRQSGNFNTGLSSTLLDRLSPLRLASIPDFVHFIYTIGGTEYFCYLLFRQGQLVKMLPIWRPDNRTFSSILHVRPGYLSQNAKHWRKPLKRQPIILQSKSCA